MAERNKSTSIAPNDFEPSMPDETRLEEARSAESQQPFRNSIARWAKFMDENPDSVKHTVEDFGFHGRMVVHEARVELLTLETGQRKITMGLVRVLPSSTTADERYFLEIPATAPNPGIQISDQKIRPGTNEYQIEPESIRRAWRSNPTAVTSEPSMRLEGLPTVDELSGLSQMLETAHPKKPIDAGV